MGVLAAITPTRAGSATPGSAVAASDTIPRSVIGGRGALLEILNGSGSVDNITISDAGQTPAGSPLSGGTYAATVAAGTSKVFLIRPQQANTTTGDVTVTHSQTATVTYKLYPL